MKADWRSRTGSHGSPGGTAPDGPSPSAVLTPPGGAHGELGPGGAGKGGMRGVGGEERGGEGREKKGGREGGAGVGWRREVKGERIGGEDILL